MGDFLKSLKKKKLNSETFDLRDTHLKFLELHHKNMSLKLENELLFQRIEPKEGLITLIFIYEKSFYLIYVFGQKVRKTLKYY